MSLFRLLPLQASFLTKKLNITGKRVNLAIWVWVFDAYVAPQFIWNNVNTLCVCVCAGHSGSGAFSCVRSHLLQRLQWSNTSVRHHRRRLLSKSKWAHDSWTVAIVAPVEAQGKNSLNASSSPRYNHHSILGHLEPTKTLKNGNISH